MASRIMERSRLHSLSFSRVRVFVCCLSTAVGKFPAARNVLLAAAGTAFIMNPEEVLAAAKARRLPNLKPRQHE